MEYMDILKEKIADNWDEQMKTLKELIAIRSVAEKDGPEGKPFGDGVDKAFRYMLKKGEEFGFEAEDVDGYGGHLEFGGEIYDESGEMVGTSDETMGIICHLDTVPEGSGWDHEPFACEEEDGRIYGRGTTDDKGPAVACLFAMKALSDAGLIPEKKVRLVFGLDEETDWAGVAYYNERIDQPDFGFTPDSEFPAVNAEMGIYEIDIAKKFAKTTAKGLELRSFRGGSAPNMVAENARVVVNAKKAGAYDAIRERAVQLREEGRMKIHTRNMGKSLEITVEGVSAHGARPSKGVNAISQMFDFLGEFTFTNDGINEFIDFYNSRIGYELNGASLGCRFEDEQSGETIVNVGMIDMDTRSVRLTVNVRCPVSYGEDSVYEAMGPVCSEYDLGLVKNVYKGPIYIPEDDPFMKTLMDIYREHTGDTEHGPVSSGGGTYARAFKRTVAFGQSMPGERECAHQKNEFIDIRQYKLVTEIYADAIYRLCRSE